MTTAEIVSDVLKHRLGTHNADAETDTVELQQQLAFALSCANMRPPTALLWRTVLVYVCATVLLVATAIHCVAARTVRWCVLAHPLCARLGAHLELLPLHRASGRNNFRRPIKKPNLGDPDIPVAAQLQWVPSDVVWLPVPLPAAWAWAWYVGQQQARHGVLLSQLTEEVCTSVDLQHVRCACAGGLYASRQVEPRLLAYLVGLVHTAAVLYIAVFSPEARNASYTFGMAVVSPQLLCFVSELWRCLREAHAKF